MRSDVRYNPGLLKLDLLCCGMRLDPTCDFENDGRPVCPPDRGVEMILPSGLYVRAAFGEEWCRLSPYLLTKKIGSYCLLRNGNYTCDITLPGRPEFYGQRTPSGGVMSHVGVLQGTYLRIFAGSTASRPIGNRGETAEPDKQVGDVLETVKAARRQEKITFVRFCVEDCGGDGTFDDLGRLIAAVKKETGLLIGVQAPPCSDLDRYSWLRLLGVNNVGFRLGVWDKKVFEEARRANVSAIGQKRFLDAIERCTPIFDTTDVDMVAGLEPPESSIEAINWIAAVGAAPMVSVYHPARDAGHVRREPPSAKEMLPVFRRVYEACMEHDLHVGIAPGVKTSIAMLPEECRYLTDDAGRFRLRETKHKALEAAFRVGFEAQQLLH